MPAMEAVTLIKLGGSLITDKGERESARLDVIERLAQELAQIQRGRRRRLIIGHGSGSYGHFAAAGSRLESLPLAGARSAAECLTGSGDEAEAAAAVQDAAARLHRLVMSALIEAGCRPYSLAPSSLCRVSGSQLRMINVEIIAHALDVGLLPVLYGDVVLGADGRAWICSTEPLFVALTAALQAAGTMVDEVIWLGATSGILDARGEPIARVCSDNLSQVRTLVGGSDGVDVTGGMALRLEAAVQLAESGVTSWVVDGRRAGLLSRLLGGTPVPGTQIVPHC